MIHQAVILAAGNGSRLRSSHKEGPKPLRKLCGLSLIKRSILTAKMAGVSDFIIVVGFQGKKIISELSKDTGLGVNLQFVENREWEKSNGVSLLRAQDKVKGDFLIMMADHVVQKGAIKKIRRAPLQNEQLVLGVDGDLEGIFDVDDATKVQVGSDGEIEKIGKTLPQYNFYDTGLFACSQKIFETLAKIYHQNGDVSLSDAVQELAGRGLAGTYDLTGFFWQDVDTPEAYRHAEKKLFRQVYKPTDGWISRNINRKISTFCTRYLLKTGLSATHVTGLVSLIGVLSGVFVSSGTYPGVLIGGLFFNLASILDGCDGEMARLKMSSSKTGEWLDTLSDNLTYVAFLIGIAVGVYHQNPSPMVVGQVGLMFAGLILSLGLMFYYLTRYTNSGSLVSVRWDKPDEEKRAAEAPKNPWLSKIHFVMKRDFFAMFFMVLAMLNQIQVILFLAVLGLNVTWVVVLAYKRTIFKIPEAAKTIEINR